MNIGETRQYNEGPFSSSKSKFKSAAEADPSFGVKVKARNLWYIFNDPDFDDFSLDSLVRAHLRAENYSEQSTKEVNGTPKSKRDFVKDGKDEATTMYKCQKGDGDGLPFVRSSIIGEREKLKETDEYKRAQEEELASRQQALQIQAEEARNQRRMRKRERAECTRLLDIERRTKQRLEEIRNTQKKNEENMNLKEVIRAEIRKDLNTFELSCRSMASLLHWLGVHMKGWPNPSPQEVQTAYKKALLTFHPDRTSQSDIRKQVEAEEKFKLINRLKNKFPPL